MLPIRWFHRFVGIRELWIVYLEHGDALFPVVRRSWRRMLYRLREPMGKTVNFLLVDWIDYYHGEESVINKAKFMNQKNIKKYLGKSIFFPELTGCSYDSNRSGKYCFKYCSEYGWCWVNQFCGDNADICKQKDYPCYSSCEYHWLNSSHCMYITIWIIMKTYPFKKIKSSSVSIRYCNLSGFCTCCLCSAFIKYILTRSREVLAHSGIYMTQSALLFVYFITTNWRSFYRFNLQFADIDMIEKHTWSHVYSLVCVFLDPRCYN